MVKIGMTNRIIKKISCLLAGIEFELLTEQPLPEQDISSISSDSRNVDQSTLFVAIRGTKNDGHCFVDQVVAVGCRTIIVEKGWLSESIRFDKNICIISVDDSHEAYSRVASAFYDYPAEKLKMVGITGTNGKTSITYLLENILREQSCRVGVIGTVSYRYSDLDNNAIEIPATLTTPEPLYLQELLYNMVSAGVEYVIMEVSSHALHQRRIGGIAFDIAVFTNLSHDHLDYHKDMEGYFQSKCLLFSHYLKSDGEAVICTGVRRENRDWANRLMELCRRRQIPHRDCGDDSRFVRLIDYRCYLDKTRLDVSVYDERLRFHSLLVGKFNVENILTALSVGVVLGIDTQLICEGLEKTVGVPGRLQHIKGCLDDNENGVVFVDYAHTPDALENVLMTLSELPHRHLYSVFGCGGDRDQHKRSMMGEVAARYSHRVILADDNPRSEMPEKIIEQIVRGVEQCGMRKQAPQWLLEDQGDKHGYVVIHEREQAIRMAIEAAGPEDIVLVAGKGHEKYQLSRQGRRFFDDCLEVRRNFCSWTLNRVIDAIKGEATKRGGVKLRGVTTDSRTVRSGDIFVALEGENFDGHDFLQQAADKGAGCLVCSKKSDQCNMGGPPQVVVADTLTALGDLAAYRRQMLRTVSNPLVIGITGSCGKTTVKEMTAAILERKWPEGENYPSGRVLKTFGNFNNLIGLPLSLLPVGVNEEAVVLEMGMNRPGEIKRLTEISDPDIACITNIHPAHLLGLHSIEGVARAKEELFAGCRKDVTLVINLDDPFIRQFSGEYKQKKICIAATNDGIDKGAQVWATDIALTDSGCARFVLHIEEEKADIVLNVAGLHNVSNSLAAAAIAHLAGASISDIIEGLQDVRSVDKRMEMIVTKKGCSILNDTYNANPASMKAGLMTLGQFKTARKVAILGDMLELGDISNEAHFDIGCFAAEQKIDQLMVVGEFAEKVGEGAMSGGMQKDQVAVFNSKEELVHWLVDSEALKNIEKNDCVLVKGSRGMRLETIVELLGNNRA